MRKPPSLRNNNGAIQLRVRINGEDYFINRLGRYADSVALAKASTISARIWQDYCSGTLDYSLESYQPVPEETADESLVKSLRQFYFSNGQGRVRHALRLVEAYGKPLRTKQQVAAFLLWMEERGIAAQTRVGILSTFRRVKPEQPAFSGHRIKVPPRSVLNDILSRTEVTLILDYLKRNDDWYFPIFFVWLGTGLRNAELIGLTWDSVDFEQGELKITKSLRRRDDSSTVRDWSNTKNRKHRIVPLTSGVLEVLQQHQQQMIKLGLYSPDGLLFLTKRSHSNLYDAVLERVWKRTLDACGVRYRKLYSQRHTFLSHTLAAGNSPADVAAIAGHRLDELLKTYAKPTGRLQLVEW
ncbi:MAG: site-specific integrase [Cyanobacteria bacterium K_DeepCast_35m_m1_288]|nr:site-specific integrase [Cyanobacteria bacterium K_DeepCast_35m_m1_288]